MKIEIWSDYVCPFCYIGKRNLETALEQFPYREQIEVKYMSFELDPAADTQAGASTHEMLVRKYGMSLEQVKGMTANVTAQAAAVGLAYRLDDTTVQNTFDAHRLSQYAATQGAGAKVAERLFKTYFIDADNIGDSKRLTELAAECGLDPDAVKAMLESDAYKEEVRAQEQEARDLHISGVPYFVIDRKYAISGARPPADFLEAITKAWEEGQHSPFTSLEGDGEAGVCKDGWCAPSND
ncbi:DsbA family oxidoreductase [Paenibacillus chungangensis]|uniref:DsbA family oxidoreductase n=1 Tax=Paenibacillus chungangensis TaxID=696535 RepID=A0ABW3HNH2_9BACL